MSQFFSKIYNVCTKENKVLLKNNSTIKSEKEFRWCPHTLLKRLVYLAINSMDKPGIEVCRSRLDLHTSTLDLCRSRLDVCRSKVMHINLRYLAL